MRLLTTIALLTLATQSVFAQQVIAPGQMYSSGEEIYTPTLGFKATIPTHWSGLLPEGSTLFLLANTQGYDGEIFLFGDTTDFTAMRAAWLQGLALDANRTLKSDGNINENENLLTTKVILTGTSQTGKQGFMVGRCGPYGRCVGALLIGSTRYFDEMKNDLMQFVQQLTFVEPVMVQPYAGFDWYQFLSNKKAVHYDNRRGTKLVNEVWFCEDGSFKSKLKRTGVVKGDIGKYKGTHRGTWKTTSFGPTGTLILSFENLPPVEVELLIKDEEVYFNQKQHVLVAAPGCN